MPKDTTPRLQPTRRDAIETRARLLRAAGETFAKSGFDNANLRDICETAGVNLGAVKYYFGSKQSMYRELLIGAHREILSKDDMPTLETSPDPENALARWIEWFLNVVLSRARHPYLGRIMVREIVQPTAALDDLVRNLLISVRAELERIISVLVVDGLGRKELTDITNMTLILCVMHEVAHPILERLGYRRPRRKTDIKKLAQAIENYALGGIRASRLNSC